jgi:hypothetical protein
MCIRRTCFKRKPVEYSSSWVMYDDVGTPTLVEAPTFTDINKIAVEHVIRTQSSGKKDERYAIWYRDKNRNGYSVASLFEPCVAPWYLVMCGNEDMTSSLAPYICTGNIVTPAFLKQFHKEDKWTYMNTQTFEDEEFPSGGITIENA